MRRSRAILVAAVVVLTGCGSAGGLTQDQPTSEERAVSLVDRPEDCRGGGFLAVSAFRDAAPRAVLAAAKMHLEQQGVAAELRATSACPALDGRAYRVAGSWTVVVWPPYFNIYDIEMARAVSDRLGLVAATVHEYDGDYWTHVVVESGRVLDRFASRPAYFAENREDAARLRREWRGDPEVVAAAFGIRPSSVRPYLIEVDAEAAERRAFAGDEFPLSSIWVFADLWRRLGIPYPVDPEEYDAVLRVEAGFIDKLRPTSEL